MEWATLSRKWTTSAGLSTTGKVRGRFGAGITASTCHARLSVTVTPDGQGFVMVRPDPSGQRVNLVLNLLDELNEKVPIP